MERGETQNSYDTKAGLLFIQIDEFLILLKGHLPKKGFSFRMQATVIACEQALGYLSQMVIEAICS